MFANPRSGFSEPTASTHTSTSLRLSSLRRGPSEFLTSNLPGLVARLAHASGLVLGCSNPSTTRRISKRHPPATTQPQIQESTTSLRKSADRDRLVFCHRFLLPRAGGSNHLVALRSGSRNSSVESPPSKVAIKFGGGARWRRRERHRDFLNGWRD